MLEHAGWRFEQYPGIVMIATTVLKGPHYNSKVAGTLHHSSEMKTDIVEQCSVNFHAGMLNSESRT